jgi:hypothetical protein
MGKAQRTTGRFDWAPLFPPFGSARNERSIAGPLRGVSERQPPQAGPRPFRN